LGQTFLVRDATAERIVDFLKIKSKDRVVEVGPGTGILTQFILDASCSFVCIEKDFLLCRLLRDRFRDRENFRVVRGDILKMDLQKLAERKRVKLISNLPYSISSEFLVYLLKNRNILTSSVITLQKEVAKRILSGIGSPIAILYRCYTDTKLLFRIPPSYFYPRPLVSSMVLYIEWLRTPRYTISDSEFFFKLVRKCFCKRRKQLKNNLGLKENIQGIDISRRAETLTAHEFTLLCNYLYKKLDIST
jgi:16S rRNA (adenine1518-N6/adenine1519-N6)-dimethyltransferase